MPRVQAALLWLALLVWPLSSASADEPVRVPLYFHVAELAGVPVADDSFLAFQLERANAIYRPLGIELVRAGQSKLAGKHARLLSRADRDALQGSLRRGVIDCFIVATLMDVDEPGRERRGVHWRVRGAQSRHFVVVSAISGPYVLAHELGHYLGNQQHSEVVGNLMSYQHTDEVPVLDAAQQARVVQTVATMFKNKQLSRNAAR